MIATFWSGLAGKLADRTALVLLGPATAFWAVGFLAWSDPDPLGALRDITAPTAGQPEPVQLALVAAGLAVLLGTGAAAARLTPWALRVMQGDWPGILRPLHDVLTDRQYRRKETLEQRWDELYAQVAEGPPSPAPRAVERELLEVEHRLSAYPGRSDRVAATRLGNVLRASDTRVLDKYGLDPARCWSALWLLVPEVVRAEVGGARRSLEAAVLWWVWSVLLAAWVVLDPRLIVLVVICVSLAYRSVVAAAVQYGELVDAAYTLHRGMLYDAAGWPRPASAEETPWGRALTTAIWRGPALADPPS